LTAILLATPILLPGCSAASGSATSVCGPWRPILVSRQDVLTRGTAADILAHNETGRRLCAW
jgi:hypothetical protein